MRVLVVDEEIPFPPNSGKRLRTFNLLKHLAQRHEIHFVCRQHEGEESIDREGFEAAGIKTHVVPHPIQKKSGFMFYGSLLKNLFSRYPYSVTSHASSQMIHTLTEKMREKPFDLLHCEWTPYAINLQSFLPFPSVVVAHNVEAMIWRRNFLLERNPAKKAYIYLQWKKMARFEEKAFASFTKVVAVSEPDKAEIVQWVPSEQVAVVENGVDVDFFRPTKIEQVPYSLVFTGAMDWRPNIDCMLFFLDQVWPKVTQRFPKAILSIVGRNPSPILQERVRNMPAVTLTGTVPDVRPYMDRALVYIVPLRFGGGSRLKILEALAMEKPVVSTSIGAEGLEVVPDQHLLIADDPDEFVRAIARLFEDERLRKEIGGAGKSLVDNKYQWKALAKKLEQVWFDASAKYGTS